MMVRIIGGHGGVSPGFKNTSYLIDGKLLIDAGSVASGIQINEQVAIDNILISHSHLDHITDLAFLADNCFGLKDRPFKIYCNKPVHEAIKRHILNDEIWPDFTKIPNEEKPTLRFTNLVEKESVQLGAYKVIPIKVNHPAGAMGFIIEKDGNSLVFTQDTGPTDLIWEEARKLKGLKAIFTEVSFPNKLQDIATISKHHTPQTLRDEVEKMPAGVPIFLGHIKPGYQDELFKEVEALKNDRINILNSDDTSYIF